MSILEILALLGKEALALGLGDAWDKIRGAAVAQHPELDTGDLPLEQGTAIQAGDDAAIAAHFVSNR